MLRVGLGVAVVLLGLVFTNCANEIKYNFTDWEEAQEIIIVHGGDSLVFQKTNQKWYSLNGLPVIPQKIAVIQDVISNLYDKAYPLNDELIELNSALEAGVKIRIKNKKGELVYALNLDEAMDATVVYGKLDDAFSPIRLLSAYGNQLNFSDIFSLERNHFVHVAVFPFKTNNINYFKLIIHENVLQVYQNDSFLIILNQDTIPLTKEYNAFLELIVNDFVKIHPKKILKTQTVDLDTQLFFSLQFNIEPNDEFYYEGYKSRNTTDAHTLYLKMLNSPIDSTVYEVAFIDFDPLFVLPDLLKP